jgi:hypothetical protein
VARFGELRVDANGACPTVEYPHQEELYFVRGGNGVLRFGEESHPLAPNDFTYLPPAVRHSVSNPGTQSLKLIVATVKIPGETPISQPAKLEVANLEALKEQKVGGHPSSVQYKLLIGPRNTKRDRISAAYAVADFFLMDFARKKFISCWMEMVRWPRAAAWTEWKACIQQRRETPTTFARIARWAFTTRKPPTRRRTSWH